MNVCIINCFDTYEHRAELLYKVFSESGNNVRILTSDYRHIEKSRRIEQKAGYIFFSAEPYVKNVSLKRLHSHIQLSTDLFQFIEIHAEQIDLLWVFITPNILVKDASKLKSRHPDIKMVFDIIDLWPETLPVKNAERWWPLNCWKFLRDKNLGNADCIVTECNLYKHVLRHVLKERTVQTLYLARPLIPYISELHLPEDRFALCYLGSINNIIDIKTIADIVKKCAIIRPVILHIIGDGERREILIREAIAAGAEVFFHGKLYDRRQKQKIFDSCHYGLNIMKASVCVGLTMKSVDYLEFGLPVINNIRGDTWEAVKKYRIGINYNDQILGKENGSYYVLTENAAYRRNARAFFEDKLTEGVFKEKAMNIFSGMFSSMGTMI